MKKSVVKFNAESLKRVLLAKLSQEQTDRLIAYAQEKIIELGNKIASYHRGHHMDRTGNLLNSLCWGVAYNNELKASGFYRDAVSTELSYLHERDSDYTAYPIDGHAEAERYIRHYGRLGSGGGTWRVWFAILAPYWGYWEKGFTMRSGGGESGIPRSSKHMQISVMSQFYDVVSRDLKPATTTIKVHVEKYSSVSRRNDYKHRVNNPYSRFNKKWMQDKRYNK